MKKLASWLQKLDAVPEPSDAMMLSQLDGYLAGILVCPELIMPGEWLPPIWNPDEAADPVFEDEKQLSSTVNLIMRHYNTIGRGMGRSGDHYEPIYDVQSETGIVIPVFWLMGFSRAMLLRPESWLAIAEGDDEDAAMALSILMALCSTSEAETGLSKEEYEELLEQAPEMIPHCVKQLNDWRLQNEGYSAAATVPKVGRNSPCPCGSGKKFKKCCGLN